MCIIVFIIVSLLFIIILLYNGIIFLNNPSSDDYPIRGVDISSYQGNIDWSIIANQGIDFAFIKATEGSSYVDEKFLHNWEESNDTNILIRTYHFFSFESSGKKQAENFINTVPIAKHTLPPVVDIELYGEYKSNPKDYNKVYNELTTMLNTLEEHYGIVPIIYTTEKAYTMYIAEWLNEYPLWIRNVFTKPSMGNDNWLFWQYTDKGRLNGYNGQEKFIDLNVFNGSYKELELLLQL